MEVLLLEELVSLLVLVALAEVVMVLEMVVQEIQEQLILEAGAVE